MTTTIKIQLARRDFLKASAALGFALSTTQLAQAQTGVTEKEILLGQFAPLTGPAAQLGLRMQAGMQAYFKYINAQGGVGGKAIKLIARDDGYEPEKAVTAAKTLINEDKVFALVGSVGTPTNLAALPIISEAKIPLIGPFTGAQALREPFNRYVFHVRASYFDETERIVAHLTTLGTKKIAVFHQNDSYGKAGLAGVEKALAKRNSKPVAVGIFERNSVDVAKALADILKAEPEVVVQIGAYKSCAAFIKQARAKSFGGQFFNVSFVGSKALADELGDAGAGVVISQVVPFPFSASVPIVRDYQLHMQAAGDKDYDFSSMEGYLVAKVTVEGLRRAGRALTRDGFISAMEGFTDVDFGGFKLGYGPKDHDGSTYTDLTIIGQGGKFRR